MKHLYILLITLATFLSVSLTAQNGWFQQANINSSPYSITSIEFSTQLDGYLVANMGTMGYVYKTSNGGTTWAVDSIFNQNLTKIDIINGVYYVVGNAGSIYKKSSSTALWAAQTSQTTAALNDVHFVHPDTGFVVGVGGVLRKTVNGGTTWTSPIISGPGSTYDFNSVYFTSANNGIIVGVYNFFQGFAVKTVSGGSYWGIPATMPSKLNKVTFTSENIGYAVGNGGVIYKTTNAGTGWILKTSGVTSQLWDVSFINDTIGYVVGENGTILKTLDGGTTWLQQPTPISSVLRANYALSNDIAWAAGDSSKVLKTTTGGISLSVSVSDTSVYCGGYAQLVAVPSYNGIGTLSYSWSSNTLLSDTAIANPLAGPINQTEVFYVTVTDGSLSATDSAIITVGTLPADSICLVSVLDTIDYNVVVFEKHVLGPIDYYKIFKETSVANVYDSIGFIPADSAGIFVDTAANPKVQAYRYKISSVDSCGNESALSNEHKTIHLTINQGLPGTWNLIWNNYEGVFINTYRIWRGDSVHTMQLLDSVAGNMTSYTDTAPPPNQVFYQIEIISSYMCLPFNYKAQTNYNTSRSNKANTGVAQSVTADFTATPTSGTAPLTVFFTDGSLGAVDTWYWDFGDGDTSMTQNPSHSYTSPGTYDVKLYVKAGLLIDSITKSAFIDVVSSIEDIDLNKVMKVYPNPVSQNQSLMIEAGGALINSIELFDAYGRIIYNKSDIKLATTKMNISQFTKGVYSLRVTTVGGNTANKLIIIE